MRKITHLTKARFAKQGEDMMPITLPHTWNNLDGQDGGNDYWRGIGIYEIDLPTPTAGKKQFIEIQGANHVATVYCNGRELGTHKGGFSTFRYELTTAMTEKDNMLTVVVSNAVCDVYPQYADFTFFGGLYRDVNFVEVNEIHFDLLKDGTSGVFITPYGTGRTRLDAFPINATGACVIAEIQDAEGNVVATTSADATEHTDLHIEVPNPHLWNGIKDPYCYTAIVKLIKDENVYDTISVTYGYRSFHVDPNTGFWLNGKNVPLRGVNRHQDRKDKGWAISKEDHEEDIALIKEIGANTIRLAHYQHDQYFYDLCDKAGLAIWAEIPFISAYRPGKAAYENIMGQMKELIAQNYNHPSIFFWGITNEIIIGGDSESLRQNLRDLHALAKQMDPSRLTTCAQVGAAPMNSEHLYITDIIGYNHYLGWYEGVLEDNGPWFDKFHALNPSLPVSISEYGVENLTNWHSATPVNHDYTEEYANLYHYEMLKMIESRPYLWGTYVWNCFDFAVDARNEGGVKGMNNKGLISHDRKVKKDAFYIYKAFWNPEPMIYIASRRFVDRAPQERDVIVYTNCDTVTLVLNGVEIATREANDHAVMFKEIPLNQGVNTITARCGEIEDTIKLNGVSEHNQEYTFPDVKEALQAGNWFEMVVDDTDNDEIEVVEGFYSIYDPIGILLAHDECLKLVKGWMVRNGNLNIAPCLENLRRARSGIRIVDIPGFNPDITERELAQLNRKLNKIRIITEEIENLE